MAHTIVVPDFQFTDDAKLERGAAGARLRFRIFRERTADRIPAAAWGEADAVLCWHEVPITAKVIGNLTRCRQIVRCGVGFDHIDLEAAGAAGIPVCNVPDYGTSEVADHAMALLLAFTRGIVAAHNALKVDPVKGWDFQTSPTTRRMRGSRFGNVGLGPPVLAVALHHRRQFGVLPGELAVLVHIARRSLGRQQRVQLGEAPGEALQFCGNTGLHASATATRNRRRG